MKDANYYVTSVVSALTAFATWRMLRFSYHIYQKKQDVKLLEETEVFGVEELKGRGSNIKDAIIVRVLMKIFREVLVQPMEDKCRDRLVGAKLKD